MTLKADHFHQLAAACDQRALESPEEEVREFFFRMRDNWLKVASGVRDVEIEKRFFEGLKEFRAVHQPNGPTLHQLEPPAR